MTLVPNEYDNDMMVGSDDGVISLANDHFGKRHRRGHLDPIDLAIAKVTPEGQKAEEDAREKFLATAKDIMAALLADLTPEQSARRLFQIGEMTEVVRQGMRVLGTYDFPEQRRRFQKRGPHAVSDAETVGAVAMTDGMAAMQASMRTKQIADLSQALKALNELRKTQLRTEDKAATTAQINALQKELNTLVSSIPAGSMASRVKVVSASKAQGGAEGVPHGGLTEQPPFGADVVGRFSGRPGVVRDVFVDAENRTCLDVGYTDGKEPKRVSAPLDEWRYPDEAPEVDGEPAPVKGSDGLPSDFHEDLLGSSEVDIGGDDDDNTPY